MPVHILEVAVRNAFHRELAAAFGSAWYDQQACPLNQTMQNLIQKVKGTQAQLQNQLKHAGTH
jgi:hypothetical protein